jgi:hypothetical protein
MLILKLIPKIPCWLLYCALNLHSKRYATRRLRDWEHVPMSRLGYALGWSFWISMAVMVLFLICR